MNFIKQIAGVLLGRRISNNTTKITSLIINHIISNSSIRLMTHDTAYVLRTTYIHASLIAHLARNSASIDKIGVANYISVSYLKDWFLGLLKSSGAINIKNEDIIPYFDEYQLFYSALCKKLADENVQLVGKSFIDWTPAILSSYISDIKFYLNDKYGEDAISDDFTKYLFSLCPIFGDLIPKRKRATFNSRIEQ